jgi:hypothetical protein
MKSLRIKNFRGIKDLLIPDLSFINIFIGSNGAGKTSVLEAAAIASSNANDPAWIDRYNVWRDMPIGNIGVDYALRSVFNGFGGGNPLKFEWQADWGAGSTAFRLLRATAITTAAQNDTAESSSSSDATDQYDGLEIAFESTDKRVASREVRFHLKLEGQKYALEMKMAGGSPPRTGGPGSFYIHARRASSMGETTDLLTTALENRTDEIVLRAVQKLHPRIKRLVPGTRTKNPIVLADIGLPRLIPVTALGDGFSRILLMITGAMRRSGGYLMVDEIDSGLHHSVMEGCWASLLELRKTRPFQILCTTHSEEMLERTLTPFADQQDLLRIYRLDRSNDDTISLKAFRYDTFRDAAFAGMEIR